MIVETRHFKRRFHQWDKFSLFVRQFDGFTFLEIILALALLSILTAIFGMGLVAAVETYAFSRANADLAQKGELAMLRMERELSELIMIHDDSARSDDITYDRIEEIISAPARTTLRLFREENTIQLVRGSDPGHTLINEVQNFSLTYYPDGSLQPFAIMINLDLQRPDAPSKNHRFTLLVRLRNNENSGGAVPYGS